MSAGTFVRSTATDRNGSG